MQKTKINITDKTVPREKRAEWEAMIAKGLASANRGDMVDGETYMQGRIAALKAKI